MSLKSIKKGSTHSYVGIGLHKRRTVLGKVAIRFPSGAKVRAPFHHHCSGAKGFEGHDQVGEGELCLQIELDINVVLAVYRLPPFALVVIWIVLGPAHDNVLDTVRVPCRPIRRFPLCSRVALEARALAICVRHDAVRGWSVLATGRVRRQPIAAANQQVANGREALSLVTALLGQRKGSSENPKQTPHSIWAVLPIPIKVKAVSLVNLTLTPDLKDAIGYD